MNSTVSIAVLVGILASLPACATRASRVGPQRPLDEIAVLLDEDHVTSFGGGLHCLVVGVRGRDIQLPPPANSWSDEMKESLSLSRKSVGHEVHLPAGEYTFDLAAGSREKAASMSGELFTAKNVIVSRKTLQAGHVYCARANWYTTYSKTALGDKFHTFRPTIEDEGPVVEWALAHPDYDNAAGDWSRLREQHRSRTPVGR